eukprot:scaffold789_cov125-Isochrysis_galbana.AAC.17
MKTKLEDTLDNLEVSRCDQHYTLPLSTLTHLPHMRVSSTVTASIYGREPVAVHYYVAPPVYGQLQQPTKPFNLIPTHLEKVEGHIIPEEVVKGPHTW